MVINYTLTNYNYVSGTTPQLIHLYTEIARSVSGSVEFVQL